MSLPIHFKPSRKFRDRFLLLCTLGLLITVAIILRFGALGSSASDGRGVRPSLSITTLPTTISQNFDTLATGGTTNPWTDNTTLPGWYSQFELNAANPTIYIANAGGTNNGAIYSFGTGTNTERAFGSASSGTPGTIYNALKLSNDSGSMITSLDISFNGEQWRNGGNVNAQTLAFQYQIATAGTITDANTPSTGWTSFSTLDFVTPTVGATIAALDGNAAANRTAKSANLPIAVNAGQEVWLRWVDINDSGNDHGVAIDDFSVTANGAGGTPTPTPTPSLSINDVTQAETNSGTTNFIFNVTLSQPAGAGGVTFQVDTADGTTNPANAGSDYVAIVAGAGSITSGNSSTTVTVQVNGDTTTEPNETFFVNISNVVGAGVTDAQGLGTIVNDDFALTPIHTIQGSGATSPLNGAGVSTSGVVTLLKSNGFFLQEPDATVDADPNTSEGIFVFTSSAPTVAVGSNVSVSGTVTEFGTTLLFGIVGTNTEINNITAVVTNSTGNTLPAAITLTATDLSPTALPSHPQLEKYEDMRMSGPLTTVAPNDSFFDVYTVLSSVGRPIREIGLEISATIPSDPSSTANIPRWDENPERLSVDTNGRAGSTGLTLTSNVSLGTVTGPLDFAFGEYHLIPEVDPTPSANMSAVPVPTPLGTEFTVACFNIENFANGTTQRTKASLAIRNVMRYPDIIGHEEIASLAALQALRDQINNDAVGAGDPNPMYEAYLQGVGSQNVGFLVKTTRIQVSSVTEEPAGTYINPLTGLPELMHDRPPLVLRATVDPSGPNPIPVIVVVNHPRSFIDIGQDPSPPGDGARVRAKRKAQSESIATLLDSLQDNNPSSSIMAVGDYNAFQFNDGYTDPIATIKGNPTADDQVVVDQSPDLVSPDFVNLTDVLPAGERYTFTFSGTSQALDHIMVNRNANARFTRYMIARFDSDFPATPAAAFVNDASRPERASDHDAPVAYFNLTTAPTAADGNVSGLIVDGDGKPVAGAAIRMSGTQNRLTITDAAGNYHFDNVETNGFYVITPSRANYSFNPASHSFSAIGHHIDATFSASGTGERANPLDTTEYFVRQQYLDFLGREPEEFGFSGWVNTINNCAGGDTSCDRVHVSEMFFRSQEFQQRGYFLYRFYSTAFGRKPDYAEFALDFARVSGFLTNDQLEAAKASFTSDFISRPGFAAQYGSLTNAEYVDALMNTARVGLSNRQAMIDGLNSGTQTRAAVLRQIAESGEVYQRYYNQAFVVMEYFGYLHRDPDALYLNWIDVLNQGGDPRHMVEGFVNSAEYRNRFAP